jgi:hypothetical protein
MYATPPPLPLRREGDHPFLTIKIKFLRELGEMDALFSMKLGNMALATIQMTTNRTMQIM